MVAIAISSGHSLHVRGARGPAPWGLDEVDENRRVVDRVAALLRTAGVTVHAFHDNSSRTVSANLTALVNFHNGRTRDRDVAVHFNAFQVTDAPRGTEVLHRAQATLAAQVSVAMARAGGFINRGAKQRSDLAFLNRLTARPAVLLEVCFVDSRADASLYRENFEAICRSIAESISGVKLPEQPSTPQPPAPPPPPQPEHPTGHNVVDVDLAVKGDVSVIVNNTHITGKEGSKNRLDLTLAHTGDVVVNIDGEDFQVEQRPPSPPPQPPPPPPTTRPTLRRGSTGEHVRHLQTRLNAVNSAGLRVDGNFGPLTEAAVRSFQQAHGLVVDGIVGPITWAALGG